jgi:LmbE family N-acetylglucosaminyl deacetylase
MSLTPPAIFDASPSRVLAIYSHPDDADVACGGALARWAAQGADVQLLLLTDGGKGTIDETVLPAQLATVRREEVAAASKELSISGVEHLDIPDGEVGTTADLVETFVRRIRSFRPDVVLGHDPTAVFFGSVYVNHRDHRAAGWALLDAVAPASGMPHYFPEAGPPHRVPDVLLSGTLEPDAYVDISSVIDAKVAAVTAHQSQLSDDLEWAAVSIRQQAAQDGRAIGVAYAEGFRHLRLDG